MTGKVIRKPGNKSKQGKAHPKRAAPKRMAEKPMIQIPADSILGKMLEDMKELVQDKIELIKKMDKKKLFLLNFPYVIFAYFINKILWLYRVSAGVTSVDKLMETLNHFERAFANPLPSFYYMDLLYGIAGGIAVKLVVYYRAKNAKKYRQGVEYGSARWGTEKDIKPYMDPVFENNIILTETERLMMSGRPKEPKYARNKNVLVIGGSGSGKTRFFVKPNLMQMHSSYVVTDPKGRVVIG
ncbi:MAG: type IV secretory system conjugative DNA transfer family protein [Lachnospiraceae bacterium]|nr:type IV secretory system conjugative DNA transfer family protein [Lachnospiraceae bacterium]